MILTWSKYQSGPASGAIGYFLHEQVRKQINGRSVIAGRDPAPEILLGSPSLVGAYIDALPFRSRYRSCVLSFSAYELDVRTFNALVGSEPRAVSGALRLLVEMAYAGVPGAARPPVLASTHTHLGRLEVNVLLPRSVGRFGEQLRSINPHPPGRASRDEWDAYADVVNATFGWSDPRCPMRRRHITPPGWMAKKAAELMRRVERGERVGVDQNDPRYRAWSLCRQATALGLTTRQEIVAHVDAGLGPFGWAVTSQSERDITCGPIHGQGTRVTFGGAALGDGAEDAIDPFDAMMVRQKEIAAAPARLAQALTRRSEFNRRQLSQGTWPDVILPDPAKLLDRPRPLMVSGGVRRSLLGRLIGRLMTTLSDLLLARAFAALPTKSLTNCAIKLETTCEDLIRRKPDQRSHGAPDRSARDAPRKADRRIVGGTARRHHRAALAPRTRDDERVPPDARVGTEVGRGGDAGRLGDRRTADGGGTRQAGRDPDRNGLETRPLDRDAGPAAGSRAEWLAVTRDVAHQTFGAPQRIFFREFGTSEECLVVDTGVENITFRSTYDRLDHAWRMQIREKLQGYQESLHEVGLERPGDGGPEM